MQMPPFGTIIGTPSDPVRAGLDRWQAENARKRDEFERELEKIGAVAYAVTETRVRVIFPGGELDVDMAFYPEGPFFDLNGYHWTALET